jgi:hypothetical protein
LPSVSINCASTPRGTSPFRAFSSIS